MNKLEKLYFVKRPYFIVLSLVSLFLIICCFSYAAFTTSVEKKGVLNIVTGNLYPSLTSDDLNDQKKITILKGKTRYFYVTLENTNSIDAKTNLYYKGVGTLPSEVEVGYVENYEDNPPGPAGYIINKYGSSNNKKEILLYIKNTSSQNVTLQFGSSVGLPNANLSIPSGNYAITQRVQPTDESCFTAAAQGDFGILYAYDQECPKDVIIPKIVNGVQVNVIASTSIGSIFSDKGLTSVVIPNGVKTIGYHAFYHNQLTSITIPKSVTSITGAFNDNQLSDEEAFIYARKSDGSEDKTTVMSYGGARRDNVIIPNTVTNIKDAAFDANQLTNVTIPSSVTTIGTSAFLNNKLTSITIPNNVTSIGMNAFLGNPLTSVIIKGKSNSSAFTNYPSSSPFGWASGYSDANITWNG